MEERVPRTVLVTVRESRPSLLSTADTDKPDSLQLLRTVGVEFFIL